MEITQKNNNPLNLIITIFIEEKDYATQVNNVLKNYRKKAEIKGFRKGNVPIGVIKKMYYNGVRIDEINKLLEKELKAYIIDKKLNILGNPLPVFKPNINWNDKRIPFDFEIGLSPEFDLDLKSKKLLKYNITINDAEIDKDILLIKKRYGKLVPKEQINDESEIKANFENEKLGIKSLDAHFMMLDIDKEKNINILKKSKVGDKITLSLKDLFKNPVRLSQILNIDEKTLETYKDENIILTIKEIAERIPATLNQELFDKLYGEKVITSEKEMRQKIKEERENSLKQQSDQYFYNTVNENLILNTKFELPNDFLKKWIKSSQKENNVDTDKEIENQWEGVVKKIRHELIENKIIKENKLEVSEVEIKSHIRKAVENQIKMIGRQEGDALEVDKIVNEILKNKNETERFYSQLMFQKLLQFYKTGVSFEEKTITYDKFLNEIKK